MLVLQVFIMRSGAFEGTEMVSGDRVEIGRDASCALLLDDESCSRRHALLYERDGQLWIEDLGSANGTRLNGDPVVTPTPVGPRDDIAIGLFTLKVKVMTSATRGSAPRAVSPSAEPTKVFSPVPTQVGASGASGSSSRAQRPAPAPLPSSPFESAEERTEVAPPSHQAKATELVPRIAQLTVDEPPGFGTSDDEGTQTTPAPPPVTLAGTFAPSQPPRPAAREPSRPRAVAAPDLASATPLRGIGSDTLDVTSPNGELPTLAQRTAPSADVALDRTALDASSEASPDAVPSLTFAPQFLPEELVPEEPELPPWSLVQRLVRPTTGVRGPESGKQPALLEVLHYRGEVVVDHRVLRAGQSFKLGDKMSRAERKERNLQEPLQLVRMTKGGVGEVFPHESVSGRLLRGGQQVDLPAAKGGPVPITEGELASLKVGGERLFVRFATAPQLVWTKEDAAEDRFARRLNAIAAGTSAGLLSLFALVSWIYQYRNADQEVIALEDEGFADVELKELKMEPPPEPTPPPEPVPTSEPVPEATTEPASATKTPTKTAAAAPAKPGVMDVLDNIPKLKDSASTQNLTAALSNIKGVRVPGDAAGVKVSALVNKGPSSGVQIGGAAGGASTNGINSLLRKDGQAGALGGKGDRAIAGKAVGMHRQLQKSGGELSKEEIQKVINQHIGEIQYCYEKQLRKQPGLAGRVVLDWTVNPQGRVSVVKVSSSSLASPEATSCMMGKLKTWKFPPPRGGAVSIVFPFVFNTV